MCMADAMLRVMTNPTLAAQLGASARRRVEERYGARAMVRRLEAVYTAVTDAAPLRAGAIGTADSRLRET
jgi:glycosyltransferase involved in cell wall biosynthesis